MIFGRQFNGLVLGSAVAAVEGAFSGLLGVGLILWLPFEWWGSGVGQYARATGGNRMFVFWGFGFVDCGVN